MIQSCTWARVQRSPALPSASQRVCELRVWDVLTGALRPSLLSVVKWKTLLTQIFQCGREEKLLRKIIKHRSPTKYDLHT